MSACCGHREPPVTLGPRRVRAGQMTLREAPGTVWAWCLPAVDSLLSGRPPVLGMASLHVPVTPEDSL